MFLSDATYERFAAAFAGGICALSLPLGGYLVATGTALAGAHAGLALLTLVGVATVAYALRASGTAHRAITAALAVALPLLVLASVLVLDPTLSITNPSISLPDLPPLSEVPNGVWAVAALLVVGVLLGAYGTAERTMTALTMAPAAFLAVFVGLALVGGAIPGTEGSSSPEIRRAAQKGMGSVQDGLHSAHNSYMDRATSFVSQAR